MTSLLIDAGNSSAKWCLLTKDSLSEQQRCDYDDKPPHQSVDKLINQHVNDVESVFIVSVLGEDFIKRLQENCFRHQLPLHNITAQKELAGVVNGYDEPLKLGADRLLAMVGAKHHYPKGHAFIIIDSGTATTIDALDASGQHWGGLIFPGVDLCTQSLLKNTQQLPLWGADKANAAPVLFAKNTSQAIQSASVLGLTAAIDSVSHAMETELGTAITITKVICGGNAKTLQPHLKSAYQLNEDLVILGLKVIAGISNSTPLK